MDLSLLLLFVTAFALVLTVELPDKTMVATLLLSARYRGGPVVAGAAGAFAVQCVIAVAFGSVLTLLPDRLVAAVVSVLFAAGAVLLLRHGFAPAPEEALAPGEAASQEMRTVGLGRPAGTGSWWRVAALSFGVLFAAEWGDASQLATAALTARSGEPLVVGLGAWLALVTVATVAVLVGRGVATRLRSRVRTRWLSRIGGLVFAGFAVTAGLTAVLG